MDKENRTCESCEGCSYSIALLYQTDVCDKWQPKSQSLDKTGQGEKESFEEEQVCRYCGFSSLGLKEHDKKMLKIYKKSLVEKIENIGFIENKAREDIVYRQEIINLIEEER